jgi:hypothetical protein
MTATGLNERFVLAEDEALKRKLTGLKVTHPTEREVPAYFRAPNKEVREVSWPYVTLDLVDVSKSDHREHSGGPFPLEYEPHGYEAKIDPELGVRVADDWPIPYDLLYAVTTWALDPRHDRQLLGQLLGNRGLTPHRMGFLEIPEDGTVRRLETLSITPFISRNANRDLEYRRIFTVRVESELFTSWVEDVLKPGLLTIVITEPSGIREEIETPYTLHFH